MKPRNLKYVHRVRKGKKVLKYFRRPGVPAIKLPEAPECSDKFISAHKAAMEIEPLGDDRNAKFWMIDRCFHKYLRTCLSGARCRANRDGVPFTLNRKIILKKMYDQNGRCEISGIKFCFDKSTRSRKRPFAPSIDRIETQKGYTEDNIRIVTQIANYARHNFSDEELYIFCRGAANKSRKNKP